MNQFTQMTENFTLSCKTLDAYDASIRLLNDAQRIGAELVSLNFLAAEGVLNMTIRVANNFDHHNLVDRLGRHPTIDAILST